MKLDYHEVLVPNETPYESYQEHINRYAFASAFVPNKVVLDMACGTGYGSSYLRKKGARVIVGGDIAKEYLDFAQKWYYYGNNIVFVQLNGTNLPFASNCFDVVVSLETIEHIQDYKRYLFECQRVLKNGGIFICSTPNKRIFSPHRRVSIPVHVHEFYIKEFRSLLEQYFTDIRIEGQRFVKLTDLVKREVRFMISEIFKIIPKGKVVKEFIKRIIHYSSDYSNPNIAKLGMEISDEILDPSHRVLPYRKIPWVTPGCLIAIAKKRNPL